MDSPLTAAADWPSTPEAMLALVRERSVNGSPFTGLLGANLEYCWDGRAELVIPIRAELTQHRGTVHGGVLGSAVDNVAGWAASTLLGPVVTSSYTIHYHAAATGERVRAIGRIQHAGRRTAVVHVDVFAEDDGQQTHVASGLAAFTAIGDRRTAQDDG